MDLRTTNLQIETVQGPRRTRRGRTRCLALIFIALAAILLAPPSGAQVFDPDYRLFFTEGVEGATGSVRTVECLLDIEPTAEDLAGWSFGICHDAAAVAAVAVSATTILDTINNGAPADFVDLASDPIQGVTCGVVFCFTSCAVLAPPATALPVLAVDYELLGAGGVLTELLYCSTVAIGGNPVPTLLVTAGAGSRLPILDPGTITILDVAFRRGDCDANGSLGIGDAIVMLGFLFSGQDAPPCLDACDTLDDGGVNIADVIRLLTFLFAGGLPPAAPYPDCGSDPTPDSVGCLAPTICP